MKKIILSLLLLSNSAFAVGLVEISGKPASDMMMHLSRMGFEAKLDFPAGPTGSDVKVGQGICYDLLEEQQNWGCTISDREIGSEHANSFVQFLLNDINLENPAFESISCSSRIQPDMKVKTSCLIEPSARNFSVVAE